MAIRIDIKVDGIPALRGQLKENVRLSDVKRIVRHNGAELNRVMVGNANFVKGYQTGTTKRSIHLAMENGGLTAVVGPTTHYAPYLEYGTRFMSAQPFVRPSFDTQKRKFISDLRRVMK